MRHLSTTKLLQSGNNSIGDLGSLLRISQSSFTPRGIGQKTRYFWQSPAPYRDCMVSSPNHTTERRQICSALIVEARKQKYLRLSFAAARPTAIAAASFARRGSEPKRNQSAGKALTASGPARPRTEEAGAVIECRRYVEIAKWSPVEWTSN